MQKVGKGEREESEGCGEQRNIEEKKKGGHYVMDEENSRKERWRNDSEGR